MNTASTVNIENNNLQQIFLQIQEISSYMWQKGWSERNAGNISVNVTAEYLQCYQTDPKSDQLYFAYPGLDPQLNDQYFFCTGSGMRIRDLAKDFDTLKKVGCIIKVNTQQEGVQIVWGGESLNFRPTSELIPHLSIHLQLIKHASTYKAVVHTHPLELIALTHSQHYCQNSRQLTDYLWRTLPEVRAFVPKGMAFIPYALPGSKLLAELTAQELLSYDVAVWEKNGVVAAGKDPIEAFDFIDGANKGAQIFLQCLSAGYFPTGM
ncbi:MAG: rhamnulose-1-phosphate aldolase, partial [Oligoflexia bacterium]|nr:rhamnulose-1-phosphate aldolase [Oligoflexia bacterium]